MAKVKTFNETRVVSYDSARSIANKVRYAVKKGLGGVMVWSMDTDDFKGDCDDSLNSDRFNDYRTEPKVKLNFPRMTGKTYPLLRTLNDAIVISLDEIRQEENIINDKENEIVVDDEIDKSKSDEPSSSTALLSSFYITASVRVLLMLRI